MKKTKMMKKNYEFRKVLSKGKYFSGNYIEAFILKNNLSYNFLGLAVSTKAGKAVRRNYIKRLIRENYKRVEENISSGYSLVFLWKKKADSKEACYKNIKEDMDNIIKKSNILKNNSK